MAVITIGNHPKALWPQIETWFADQYSDLAASLYECSPLEEERDWLRMENEMLRAELAGWQEKQTNWA